MYFIRSQMILFRQKYLPMFHAAPGWISMLMSSSMVARAVAEWIAVARTAGEILLVLGNQL